MQKSHLGDYKSFGSVDILWLRAMLHEARLKALEVIGQAQQQRLQALRLDTATWRSGRELAFNRRDDTLDA
jgi:hypothetical protein